MTERESVDLAWVLLCAGLVFLMQAGFTCLEAGFTRAKNNINVAVKNMADFVVTVLLFWAIGYTIMFGPAWNGLIGLDALAMDFSRDPKQGAFFLFQAMFCSTAATIISGATAERMRLTGYLAIAALVAIVFYPFYGHWAWNSGGWLANLGFVDFAGSTVVHSLGGWMALASIMVIGPRMGRFGPDGTIRSIQGSDQPLAVLGTLLLYLGWFGFNGGSTLAIDERVPGIIVNTVIAGAAGSIAPAILSMSRERTLSLGVAMNGAIAGLVAITANAHAVSTGNAVIIGAIGGLLMLATERAMPRWGLDDVVGAVPAHLVPGIWGTLAVALFGRPEALGTGLDWLSQLGVQALGVVVCGLWAFGLGYPVIKLVDHLLGLRVPPDDEDRGLNISEHGATTDLVDLFHDMEAQASSGDPNARLRVEPFTEVGAIAFRYNRVMDALERAMAQSDTIVRSARDAILTFAGDTLSIISANPAAQTMFGYPAEALAGKTLVDLIPQGPDVRASKGDMEAVVSELLARRADGKIFPVEVSFSHANLGRERFSIALMRDVTERRRVERALKDSETRYAQIMRAANDGLYDWDLTLNEIELSPRLQQIIGEARSTVSVGEWVKRIHEEDHDTFQAILRAHIKGLTDRFAHEYRFQAVNGIIWIRQHGVALRDGRGRVGRVVGGIGDITERKRAQETLRLLMDSIPLPVLVTTLKDGEILFCNDLALTSYNLEKGTGRDRIGTLYRSSKERDSFLRILKEAGEVNGFEAHFKGPKDEDLWLMLSARLIEFQGQPSILTVTTSITERKVLEEGLRDARENAERALANLREAQDTLVESEKMASLGGLVAGVAHEINTPVGIVLTAATHLQEKTQSLRGLFEKGGLRKSDFSDYLSTAAEATAMMVSNITRAADLIQSFKQVAVDQSSDNRRTFNLRGYLSEVLPSLGPALRKTRHSLDLFCPDDIKMDSYPGALSQVVTNLVMNALTHAFPDDRKGSITLTVTPDSPGWVRLTFADDGVGIPRNNLKRIFDPFFTTKRGSGGSGLGLNIVYNIVNQTLGGRVLASSTEGEGATFTLTLPEVAPETHPLSQGVPGQADDSSPLP
ncbi:MAG: ammonium transporter [Rhodospirillum sp.]|nr:ammonium transporter [Rhodospirillum sp.]MCF8487660.1 ammonium transporter [Rhodospirillum sp.]MCF8500405.1 ammonium transporter [Rhodospirillum sp.]